MNLTPQEIETRRLLKEPTRKSNIYGVIVAAISIGAFIAGFFSTDRAALFAGAYIVAIYAFLKYLWSGIRYSESVRTLIEKYEGRIAEFEKNEPIQPPQTNSTRGPD